MKTIVLNLYGGPGTGKSTTAAGIFYKLKSAGVSCELVREYVKDWAWDKRSIQPFDQIYFLGKQVRRESMLYGKVPLIVTDAPVFMNLFYARKFSPPHLKHAVEQAVTGFYMQCKEEGIEHRHICLARTKKYDPTGRYQTEDEAREMDWELRGAIGNFAYDVGFNLSTQTTDDDAVEKLAQSIIAEMRVQS